MKIEVIAHFFEKAAFFPAFFWQKEYRSFSLKLYKHINKILENISVHDMNRKKIEKTLSILSKKEFFEEDVLEVNQILAEIFKTSGKTNPVLLKIQASAEEFAKRYRNENNFKIKRDKLKKVLKLKKQQEHDLKLLIDEGSGYILEFYLAAYKKLSELKIPQEQQAFITAKDIDLGSGRMTGLKADLEKDETLNKFILYILNDKVREELLLSYYTYKNGIFLTEDADNINYLLHNFIHEMLLIFQKNGLEKLKTVLFEPYGKNPSLNDLLKVF